MLLQQKRVEGDREDDIILLELERDRIHDFLFFFEKRNYFF